MRCGDVTPSPQSLTESGRLLPLKEGAVPRRRAQECWAEKRMPPRAHLSVASWHVPARLLCWPRPTALCPRSAGRRPELPAGLCRTDGCPGGRGPTPSAPLPSRPQPSPQAGCAPQLSGRPRAVPPGALGQWSRVLLLVWGWHLLQAPRTPGPGSFNSLRLVAACVGPGIPLAGSRRQQVCRTFGPCPRQRCLSLLVRGAWARRVPQASGRQPAAGRRPAPGRAALAPRVRGWLPPVWCHRGQHPVFL